MVAILSSGCGGSGGSSASGGSTSGAPQALFKNFPGDRGDLSVVSRNGAYVATATSQGHLVRIRVSDASQEDLGTLGSGSEVPRAISDDGTIIAGTEDRSTDTATIYVPFEWRQGSGFTKVGPFAHSVIDAASANFTTLGGSQHDSGHWLPFTVKGDTVSTLSLPSKAIEGYVLGITASGAIMGAIETGEQTQVVRWNGTSAVPIGQPFVSSIGSVVIGSETAIGIPTETGPALMNGTGAVTQIDTSLSTRIRDISDNGSVVVGETASGSGDTRAFIYTSAHPALMALRDAGAAAGLDASIGSVMLKRALNVSADGRVIVGLSQALEGGEGLFVIRLH